MPPNQGQRRDMVGIGNPGSANTSNPNGTKKGYPCPPGQHIVGAITGTNDPPEWAPLFPDKTLILYCVED